MSLGRLQVVPNTVDTQEGVILVTVLLPLLAVYIFQTLSIAMAVGLLHVVPRMVDTQEGDIFETVAVL